MAYVSETTKFLDELLEKNPQLIEQQRRNRLTWWDRPQDLETMHDNAESNVSQPAYVYFPLPKPKS
jgi:hypothetical protein